MKCKECGYPLMLLSSLNKKICYNCGKEFAWILKYKQKPLIKHQR